MTDTVFVLSRWATCADHMEYGPLVFATFEAAREYARTNQAITDPDLVVPDGWFQRSPGVAHRWCDPKDHDGGYWEILTCPVQGGAE